MMHFIIFNRIIFMVGVGTFSVLYVCNSALVSFSTIFFFKFLVTEMAKPYFLLYETRHASFMQVLLILYSWRLERTGQRCHMCAFLVCGRPAASRGRRWSPPQCAVEQSDVRKGEKARCGGRRRLSLEEVNNIIII